MEKVEKLKSTAIVSFIPELIFAMIAMFAFWSTIGQPESMTPTDQESPGSAQKYSIGFAPDLVNQAMALEPGRLMAQGRADQSVKKALELAATRPYDVLADVCAGNVLCQVGDKEEGFRLLKKAVALAPRSRYIRMNLAEKLALNKRYDQAINQFDLIVNGYPHWTKPHLALANIYLATEHPDRAAAELKLALDWDPNNGTVRKQRALALASAGQFTAGLEEYVRGDIEELNSSGMPKDIKLAAENWGSIDRAEYQYRRELDNDSGDPLIKLRLARILIYRGQTVPGKELLVEARKKAPANAEIHRNLALVLQKLGESVPALAEFRISVNLEKAAAKAKQEQQQQF